jgi:hypothetical protein
MGFEIEFVAFDKPNSMLCAGWQFIHVHKFDVKSYFSQNFKLFYIYHFLNNKKFWDEKKKMKKQNLRMNCQVAHC